MSKPLLTPTQAAAYLTMSMETLERHVRAGASRYIVKGLGKRRTRQAFDRADLDAFKDAQLPQMVPGDACRSASRRGARNTSTTSGTKVIGFMAPLARGKREALKIEDGPRRKQRQRYSAGMTAPN